MAIVVLWTNNLLWNTGIIRIHNGSTWWYSWVALPQINIPDKFTSLTKTYLVRLIYFSLKLKTYASTKLHPYYPTFKQKTYNTGKLAPMNLNGSTVITILEIICHNVPV